jgi:hypothetical protein
VEVVDETRVEIEGAEGSGNLTIGTALDFKRKLDSRYTQVERSGYV